MGKSNLSKLLVPLMLIEAMNSMTERPERGYSPPQKKGASPYKKSKRKTAQASKKRNR